MQTGISNEVIAFGFNLYDDGDFHWSMELIGTSEFDVDDEDWLCNEVTDFDTRDGPFQWCGFVGYPISLRTIFGSDKKLLFFMTNQIIL